MDDNRNEDGHLKVSQSKVRQWRECRRKFWYAHVMKIQRRRQPRPLAFGSISHKMKEALAQGEDPYEVLENIPKQDLEAYREDPEKYGDILKDLEYANQIFGTLEEAANRPTSSTTKYRNEHPFEVVLEEEGIMVKGTIDAVTKYRQMNWLTEHKNHKNIPNDDERWRSVQSVVYIKVARCQTGGRVSRA